jgi:hypothetical protein
VPTVQLVLIIERKEMPLPNLVLNCFSIDISPTSFDLPFADYESHPAATEALRKTFVGFLAQRHTLESGRVRVVLLNGPDSTLRLESQIFDVGEYPNVGAKLISRSLSDYLASKGMRISHDKSTTKAVMTAPAFSKGLVDLFNGLEFQVRRPFEQLPYGFIISVQWSVSVLFRESLLASSLREMAIGMPVLYKPDLSYDETPKELRDFRHRYIGHIRKIESSANALVNCKDGETRSILLSTLYLEGSPAVIREYESQSGLRRTGQSIWHKVQELEFVLNRSGRRNSSVLKDRLQAIRKLFGSGPKEQLVLPLNCFRRGSLNLSFLPSQVEMR